MARGSYLSKAPTLLLGLSIGFLLGHYITFSTKQSTSFNPSGKRNPYVPPEDVRIATGVPIELTPAPPEDMHIIEDVNTQQPTSTTQPTTTTTQKSISIQKGVPTDPMTRVSKDGKNTLILIPVNLGYLPFGINLMCSMQKHNIENFIFLAMDDDVYKILLSKGLPVYKDKDLPFVSSGATGWGDDKFHSLVCTKLIPVINLLKQKVNIVLTDADIVWVKDPRPYFRTDVSMTFSIGSCHRELPDNKDFTNDAIAKMNTGFYFAQSTEAVITMFQRSLSVCRNAHLTGDQPAMNQILTEDAQARQKKYTYGFFDGCLFANGCVFFKHLCANTTRKDPVIVHANFVVGKKSKIKSLNRTGLWFESCISNYI
eukprot:PhF_6_TR8527/c0_g1_i1/m.13361